MKSWFNFKKKKESLWKYLVLIGGLIELIIYITSNSKPSLYAGLILIGIFILALLVEKFAFRKK